MLISSVFKNKLCWIDRYYYFVTVFSAGLLVISSGCATAWTSPTVPKLHSGNTPVTDGIKDTTGVGYLFFIGCVPGFVITWLFLSHVGRRAGMLVASLLYATSWIIMSLATTLSWIYGARFLQGLSQSMALTIPCVYVVEISPVAWREAAGFSLQFFFNLGLLLQYSIGPYVSYLSLIYFNLSIALLFFVVFILIAHETPYFHLMNNRGTQAEKVLRKFRNHVIPPNEEGMQREIEVMKRLIEESGKYSMLAKFKLILTDKGNRRALYITLGLTYLFVFSGLTQFLMFTEPLLIIAKVDIDPSLSCIFIGLVKLIGGFLLPFFVKRFGIKSMAVYSTIVCIVAMFFLALFYTLKSQGYLLLDFFWAPLTLFLIYFLFSAVGLAFIMMHVRAEIFPPHLTSTGILMQDIVNIICLEICSLFFTQLLQVAVYIPMWFFTFSMIISVIFILVYVPDSKSMSLYDIQQWLNR